MKTRMRESAKARVHREELQNSIPKEDLVIPFHEIAVPIYRPVMVGERILESDRRCWLDKLVRPDSERINCIATGAELYLRPITTLTLQVHIK